MNCTEQQAEEILKTLGKEDLLFCHHGEVMARPDAYKRMAELIDGMIGTSSGRPMASTPTDDPIERKRLMRELRDIERDFSDEQAWRKEGVERGWSQ
jgi:hypothetical protein